jgi:hypothetical protein
MVRGENQMQRKETKQSSDENRYFMEGYNGRDQRVASHFFYLVQVFAIFTAILGTTTVFLPNSMWKLLMTILLFIIVSMAIITLIADIQANISCKNALRKKMESLNSEYWAIINSRKKGYIEKLIKQNETSVGNFFIITSYLILFAWIIICVTSFLYK